MNRRKSVVIWVLSKKLIECGGGEWFFMDRDNEIVVSEKTIIYINSLDSKNLFWLAYQTETARGERMMEKQ